MCEAGLPSVQLLSLYHLWTNDRMKCPKFTRAEHGFARPSHVGARLCRCATGAKRTQHSTLGGFMHAVSRTQDADGRLAVLLGVVNACAGGGVDVFCWRSEQLESAGYDAPAALSLAASRDVDLHRACELLAGGCPQDVALRILR
jgi:hypothetical protein